MVLKNIENDDCRDMTVERILEMFSIDTLRKAKSAAKTCKVSTIGSKMDIIIQIKTAALKDVKNIRKFFYLKYGFIWEDGFRFLARTELSTA